MAVRDDRSDVKQTTAGFRGPLMVQSLTSAKSKFLSLGLISLSSMITFSWVPFIRTSQQQYVAIIAPESEYPVNTIG